MITRRHIRIKAMQVLYAATQSESNETMPPRDLLEHSVACMLGLYLTLRNLPSHLLHQAKRLLKAEEKKYIETGGKHSNQKFISNQFLEIISETKFSKKIIKKYNLIDWTLESKYLRCLYDSVINSQCYSEYIDSNTKSFEDDKRFIIDLYTKVIAPDERLMECIEDHQFTWVDDYPFINTLLLKEMKRVNQEDICTLTFPSVFKNSSDKEFAYQLLEKTIEESERFKKMIAEHTINWDTERIAKLDTILLKMALCEAFYIDNIPVKVTINEYVEIAKEYATPKSSVFINGVLDKILKEHESVHLSKKRM